MPPVNQGSKAALITWTVVATVFGITMAVLALIAYTGQNTLTAQLQKRQNDFNEVANANDMQSTRLTELRAQAKAENLGNVYQLLTTREEQLAQGAAGTTQFDQAQAAISATLERVNAQNAGQGAPVATLTGAVDQLQTQLAASRREQETLTTAQTELEARLQNEEQVRAQMLADKDAAIAALTDQLKEAQVAYNTVVERTGALETGTQSNVEALKAEWEEKLRESEDRLTQVTRALENAERQVQILTQQNFERFSGDQMIAAADGSVLRSPSQGRLYINLGRGQRVTNGMTFQVYDPIQGIPKASADRPAELPKGKGSIQVIRVDPNSSEARIVNQEPGQIIREGDLIANLAYDKNVPVRFRIFGDYDLDHNGATDPRDRDRVLTLVREFGGRLVEDVTVETDVLVMGKEPEVPRMTEADLQDPINAAQHANAVKQRDEYISVRNQAQRLNVPILNQNQFLYYVGYFDQVMR